MRFIWAILLVLSINLPVQADTIFVFTAKWCGPCQLDKPGVEAVHKAGVDIRKVDIDERPDLKAHFGITFIPQYVSVRFRPDGSYYETGRIQGRATEGQLYRLSVMPLITTVGNPFVQGARSVICPTLQLFGP